MVAKTNVRESQRLSVASAGKLCSNEIASFPIAIGITITNHVNQHNQINQGSNRMRENLR